jgi:hypothetical protein
MRQTVVLNTLGAILVVTFVVTAQDLPNASHSPAGVFSPFNATVR